MQMPLFYACTYPVKQGEGEECHDKKRNAYDPEDILVPLLVVVLAVFPGFWYIG